MADSVIINKVSSIERCLQRIKEDYYGHEADFETNFMRQDAIVLNLQRACELSIDLANHLVRLQKLGVPKNSREAFTLLLAQDILSEEMANNMIRMVGFRNVAVHQYSQLNLMIIRSIIERHLEDFEEYTKLALSFV